MADLEGNDEAATNIAGKTLQSILHIGGRAAAQAWGMQLLRNKSAETIRRVCEHWPPEVLELMAEKLAEDERFR